MLWTLFNFATFQIRQKHTQPHEADKPQGFLRKSGETVLRDLSISTENSNL